MTLAQHMAQAERAYDKIKDVLGQVPMPVQVRAQIGQSLQGNARKFWLYPLVEAKRGRPY